MVLNQIFELSMALDAEHFQQIFARTYNKVDYLKELGDEYLDESLSAKGITVIYRDSRYKKKIRLLINTGLVLEDVIDADKLICKLDKRIDKYFSHKYSLNNFILSGASLVLDINVGSRSNVSDYLKVLQRVSKVKGFSPVSYECFEDKDSFCLEGNSNDIDFLLYSLESAVTGRLRSADVGRKKIESANIRTRGILRAEVRLTKPKSVRVYTDAANTSAQIAELVKNGPDIFMDIFARVVPSGVFHKKDKATEIIRSEVKDKIMRRRMLRLLTLIPEKKSLHLAQKAMNCRNVEKVMESFVKINLSPVTISKRHDVKYLENIYSYFL